MYKARYFNVCSWASQFTGTINQILPIYTNLMVGIHAMIIHSTAYKLIQYYLLLLTYPQSYYWNAEQPKINKNVHKHTECSNSAQEQTHFQQWLDIITLTWLDADLAAHVSLWISLSAAWSTKPPKKLHIRRKIMTQSCHVWIFITQKPSHMF